MDATGQNGGPIRFGVFEADLLAHSLRKGGARVRLQEKPFRVLAMLLVRPGEVVTREELKHELWPDEEYGEFDLGLNTAVKKVRQALNDSGDSPRWIETVPKVGYKFLAPVTSGSSEGGEAQSEGPAERKTWVWPTSAALLAPVAFAGRLMNRAPDPPARPVYRFTVYPPEGAAIRSFEVSPDGRHLALVAQEGSRRARIWLRSFDDLTARPLAGTEGCDPLGAIFWSPDSRFIGFFANQMLKKVGIGNEPAADLAAAPFGRGGAWNEQGMIVFAPLNHGPDARLFGVPSRGGTSQRLTSGDENSHRSPQVLPSGREVLFHARVGPAGAGGELRIVEIASGKSRALLEATSHGVFLPEPVNPNKGHLLTVERDVLMAYPLDAKAGRIDEAFPALQDVGTDVEMSRGLFSISASGVLAYAAQSVPIPVRRLVWVDRQGRDLKTVGPERNYSGLRLAPDRSRVAVAIGEMSVGYGLGVIDLATNVLTQPAPGHRSTGTVWARDGEMVLFSQGGFETFAVPADGSAEPRLLRSHPDARATDVSPDGKWLLYHSYSDDVFVASRDGETEPKPFLSSEYRERAPRFSPDGRYVAYASDESGEEEVYVRRFPNGDQKAKVSVEGGSYPIWGPGGSELFFVSPNDDLMVVQLAQGPDGRLVRADQSTLFKLDRDLSARQDRQRFDIGLDGKGILILRDVRSEPSPITVAVNWNVELARLAEKRRP
jgi:DNA-binding winged helix-turn-helix (wHTH) protein/Tol biopolymer transport system component